MPTIYTHAIVGAGLGNLCIPQRRRWLFWALVILLPVTPDLDAFSKSAYGSITGHRGFTHSLVFAALVGVMTAFLVHRALRVKLWALSVLFFAVTASHSILDMFTDGGFGIPLLWPVTDQRFGPYGPIRVTGGDLTRSITTEIWYVWLPTAGLAAMTIIFRRIKRQKRKQRDH